MKKKFISICITLILFLCSVVPTFALDTVADVNVPYWLLDIRQQCFLAHNVADVKFGLAIYGDEIAHYLVEIVGGGDLYLTYEVPAGETVYFRWAIARNNMGNHGFSTHVRRSINGTPGYEKIYDYNNLGDYGTYGSIVIVEDYTNTTNATQMVTYVLGNNHTTATTTTYEYVPILVGTDVIINQGMTTDFGEFDYTVDLTNVEDKLDDIFKELGVITSLYNRVNFNLPLEFYAIYRHFITCYNYSVSFEEGFSIPWLVNDNIINSTLYPMEFRDETAIYHLNSYQDDSTMYFSVVFHRSEATNIVPTLYDNRGNSAPGVLINTYSLSSYNFHCFTYEFDTTGLRLGKPMSLALPNSVEYTRILPIYFGNGSNVTEEIAFYSGLPTSMEVKTDTIIDKLSNIIDIFSGNSTTSNNANIANDNLNNTVTEFDNIEKNQVDNMTENLNNLPTLDFNAYNDFAPTVQFVSSTMQQIYDSNQYLRLLINACLLIGIALLLIGRGNRK